VKCIIADHSNLRVRLQLVFESKALSCIDTAFRCTLKQRINPFGLTYQHTGLWAS